MKALSVHHPWAFLIARGHKSVEQRGWPTRYRGDLVICSTRSREQALCNASACGLTTDELDECLRTLGQALCIVRLVDCVPFTRGHERAARCDSAPNHYAWLLADRRPLKPFPVRGMHRLWDLNADPALLVPSALSAPSALNHEARPKNKAAAPGAKPARPPSGGRESYHPAPSPQHD